MSLETTLGSRALNRMITDKHRTETPTHTSFARIGTTTNKRNIEVQSVILVHSAKHDFDNGRKTNYTSIRVISRAAYILVTINSKYNTVTIW